MVLRTKKFRVERKWSKVGLVMEVRIAYRIVGFACLAERLRGGVDFLNHFGEVLVQFVQPILQLLC